tara:strand:+ start:549 stop:3794 length:3246 start_codon:yes stop_codon:yes gene_type:complete
MALVSPGVQVSVIDESFYTPAEPGTVPMIFVVSAQDKINASGTGTATATTSANAEKPYLITSQRELVEMFGDPTFYTDSNNNALHGNELNEYGLQAAYSYLGVANRAYVTRANLNTTELTATATAPAANPADGTYWFDTANSVFGIFEWNSAAASTTGGQSFTNKIPTVITDSSKVTGGAPKTSVGAVGDYAVVATTTLNKVYYKNSAGAWVQVGSSAWIQSWATVTGTESNPTVGAANSMSINGSAVTAGGTGLSDVVTAIAGAGIAGITSAVVDGKLEIYSTGADVVLALNGSTLLTEIGLTAGTYKAPALTIAPHTSVPEYKSTDTAPKPTGSLWAKTTTPNLGANWKVKKWNATTKLWETVTAPIYETNQAALYGLDKTGGGANLAVGALYINYNNAEDTIVGDFKIHRRVATGNTSITSSIIAAQCTAGTYAFNMQETIVNSATLSSAKTISVTTTAASSDADVIAGAINSAGFTNIVAEVDASNRIVISHNDGGDFRIKDTGGILGLAGYSAYVDANSGTPNLYTAPTGDSAMDFVASNWQVLTYTASATAVTALTSDKTLWYSSVVDEVDMMIHNGTTWVGYQDSTAPYYQASASDKTDPKGPIVSATEPTLQSDSTALKNGDLWISTADLENYPKVYKYNGSTLTWVLVDGSDQTTEDGILFADARYNTNGANSATAGTIEALLSNNFLDPDAPDPALYPKGMLLWNLRRSGFNVKKFVRNSVDTAGNNGRFNNNESMASYYAHRWVTESANQANGAGSFGRKAQRKVVVQALQSMVNSNQDIRDDQSRIFNLMACPGYSELIGEMVTLNTDRGLTAFVVGDLPFRLSSDATTINNYATNVNLAVEDNDDGLVTSDEYMGTFYPSLFTSDNAGKNIVVPASHGILRTIALSDSVSFPWFAPAGTRRGGISNASSAGYIDAEGEFKAVALNTGQRDTLYSNKINPITFLTGAGLVNYGQKTRAKNASALDRINVARLVVYLRGQLDKLAKPYIFEPNDKITRDEIKAQADSLMLELVGQRALYDFLVVCDESNNTPTRIDRNELYLDIAIEPVKAVEFIYIPLRLKNTGEIAKL